MRCNLLSALFCAALFLGSIPPDAGGAPDAPLATVDRPDGRKLLLQYPGIRAVTGNEVIFTDGTVLPYDDFKDKTLAEKLDNSSIRDHFTQAYPAFTPIKAPAHDVDPGRFRNDPLFRKLYGANRSAVEKNLVAVKWLPRHVGTKVLFNGNEGAAAQLRKVSDELDALPEQYLKYLTNISGTYAYRTIAGTGRLSAHSYGIAIDLNTRHSSYWLWDKERRYRNEIPQKIVDIFEKHGFVWGGRWYHYDTMHFEYRPEMFTTAPAADAISARHRPDGGLDAVQ